MTTALIDADVLAYQAAAAGEHPVDWGDGVWTLHCFEDEVVAIFEAKLKALLEKTKATSSILAFTSADNFRYGVLPSYKSNRAKTRRPMLLQWIKDYAMGKYKSYLKPTLEGDDCLGILSTCGLYPDPIIVSIDKDFKTIPGKFFDFGRDIWYDISEAEADYWHMYQTLIGDITDGYKGCPGVGDVTARRILDGEGPMWPKVVAAFKKAKLGEEEALVQARVARICRSSDYDYNKKEVILWTPHSMQ